MKKRTADIAVSCIIIVLAGTGLCIAQSFPGSAKRMPTFVLSMLIILSILQFISAYRKKHVEQIVFVWNRILKIIFLTVGFVAATAFLGFYLSVTLFLILTMYLFGVQNKIALILVPGVFLAFVYIVFDHLLGIHPPVGILF